MDGKLTTSLQESLLTLSCVNDQEGAIAAGIVDTDLFEPPYDDIAQRAIRYRAKFGRSPGTAHLDDLFDHVLSDPKHKQQRLYQQVLGGILEQAKSLNAKYVLSRTNDFQRQQHLKVSVLEAAQRYQVGGDDLIPDVEKILHSALKFRVDQLDAGTFLNDKKRALSFLTNPQGMAYGLGIKEFDRRGIGPSLGKAFGFMAPKGKGKTWFVVDAAVKMLLQRAKVVHISLEMGEEELMQRYMMRLFAIAKRNERFETTIFEFDELNRLAGFTKETKRPRLNFDDPVIVRKLTRRLNDWGGRFGNLVVKQFPNKGLTTAALEAYLDGLELTYGFVPHGLIVDYPKLMKLPKGEQLRHQLGEQQEELRGVCVKRNLAGIFPIQSNRAGESVKIITGENIGEDYSLAQTVDSLVTYNQTKFEKAAGLARLFVDKHRSDTDGLTVLISQSYDTGQFVLNSAYVPRNYFKKVKTLTGNEDEEADE